MTYQVIYGQSEYKRKPHDSDFYLKELINSKNLLFEDIIREFDQYLSKKPSDIDVRIDKCIILEKAYYDSYDDYNPKQEEFEICLDGLVRDFPNNIDVLILKLKTLYSDSAIAFCNRVINQNKRNPGNWEDYKLSFFYEKLSLQYSYLNEAQKSIENAVIAESLNDTLDMSVQLAQQYISIKNYDKAKSVLMRNSPFSNDSWELVQKGELLLELGLAEKAVETFNLARLDTTQWIDYGKVAEALISSGMYSDAREFLLKDLSDSYQKSLPLHRLFEYDYKYSSPDTLFNTYEALMNESFYNDALGKYRIMMIFKKPFSGWRMNDILKLGFILLLVLFGLIIPYLWILPIHYVSNHYKIASEGNFETRWGLKHLWLICSAIILLEFLVLIIFGYHDLLNVLSDDYYISEEVSKISRLNAHEALFFFFCMLFLVISFTRKSDYALILNQKWNSLKSVIIGFASAFLLRTVYFSLVRLDLLPEYSSSTVGSVTDYLASINEFYDPFIGFLIVVLIVPIYEEFLFRAIMLGSIEKKLKFFIANMIQSLFFSLMHDNLSLFFFYFSFGMIAGYLFRRSNSLLPSIVFHATNNLFAFITLIRIT